MKIKVMLSYIMSVFAFAVAAQGVENDDMYFNSKDRAALRATRASELSYTADAKKPGKKNSENKVEEENVNPTDSYSARTVNPEFAARSNAQSAQADNEDYFVNDYKYTTTSNFSNWNNNYNRWYNNPWYTSAYFGPNINTWNSPYYGYYDPYYSPWYDPYWNNSGWSASFSYHYGSSWNYGWGGNYNYWNRPYCGWASSWGPSYGYGYGWGSSWYGYPRTIVVVDRSENYAPNYGKRPSRSSHVAGSNIEPSNREATRRANSNSVREQSTGGRVATQNGAREYTTSPSRSAQTEQYYDRSWRRTQQSSSPSNSSQPSYSAPQRSATYDRPSNYGNSSNSGYSAPQRSYNRDNSSFSSPSRSSSTPSYNSGSSGGSRSGGSSTSGSGSRRGRD